MRSICQLRGDTASHAARDGPIGREGRRKYLGISTPPDDGGIADCVDGGIRLAISDAQHALAVSGHPAMARSIDFGKVQSERLIVTRYHCSQINLNMDEAMRRPGPAG